MTTEKETRSIRTPLWKRLHSYINTHRQPPISICTLYINCRQWCETNKGDKPGLQAEPEVHWRGMSMNCNLNEGPWSTLPSLPLDVNANGHSEQFKHSCIVQPGHCGFHCHKSNVTALGSGTRDCHCLNKLYKALRRYFSSSKRTLLHRFFFSLSSWKCFCAKLLAILICCSLHDTTSLNLLFNQEMSPMHAPGAPC